MTPVVSCLVACLESFVLVVRKENNGESFGASGKCRQKNVRALREKGSPWELLKW